MLHASFKIFELLISKSYYSKFFKTNLENILDIRFCTFRSKLNIFSISPDFTYYQSLKAGIYEEKKKRLAELCNRIMDEKNQHFVDKNLQILEKAVENMDFTDFSISLDDSRKKKFELQPTFLKNNRKPNL